MKLKIVNFTYTIYNILYRERKRDREKERERERERLHYNVYTLFSYRKIHIKFPLIVISMLPVKSTTDFN